MTVDEINEQVEKIKAHVRNDSYEETAHRIEEELYCDVLQAIADGATNPRELAQAALATLNIEFTRWYA